MTYEFKYLVGEIGEKANELWETHPEVMDAVGKEAVNAWKTGYKQGFAKTCVSATVGGAVLGALAFVGIKIWKHRQARNTEVSFEEF